jgi:uncharacterized membrane protein
MSVAHAFSPPARTMGSRWLLLGSLALNLFFVGVAVAMTIRAPAPAPRWDPDVFVRIERLSATLPPGDADILRGAYQANHDRIAGAQAAYQDGRRSIHEILRQDPFKIEDLRDAMAKTRTARQAVDQAVQSVFADTVVKLSPAARHAIADWRPVNSSKRDRQ